MAITKDNLSKLTCAEIRVQLKERELRLYGLKSELINRLWDDMQQDASGGDDNNNDINNFNEAAADEVDESEIEVEKSNGEQSSSPPTLQSSAASSSSTTTTTTTKNNRWYYPLAILPLPLILFLSSHLLRNTITSPIPSDYGSGSMFDLIATRYDFINRALALNLDMGWRHRLVDAVVGVNGEIFQKKNGNEDEDVRFLDLATGTADVAILLGKAATKYNYQPPPSSSTSTSTSPTVLGLDPSNNMLNVGKSKVQQFDLTSTVQLDLGDARDLNKIPNDTFNVATMSFGIRNVPEKEVALCEIHRVLKKKSNSKLAIMEFSEPGLDSGVLGSLARLFIRHLVPAMGALLSGYPKEYMHLQQSIKDFPSPAEFVELMEGIKCPIIKAEDGGVDQLEQIDTWGSFRVKEVVNLNFGSVQIYIANPILKQMVTE